MVAALTDAELVRRIGGSDGAVAEAELCRRFAPRIRLYGLRHLRSEDRAADLVQVVLLALLEAARAGRIAQPEHVEHFVIGTCRNRALRVQEHDRRMRPAEGAELDTGVFLPAIERVDARALDECMRKLDDRSRAVVVMSFSAEEDAAEIARRLDMSPGNVRVVRHRALAQLRGCLDRPRGGAPS